MRTIRMSRELHLLFQIQHQHALELPPDILKHLLRLVGAPPLSARRIALSAPGEAAPHALGPEADSIVAAAHVHDDAHYLAVVGVFEGFADGGEHHVEPEGVDGGVFALEAVGPFAAVLVLGIFPFGADTAFEEVVVGFEG